MAGCADQVKRVTLELGGKSANIVFADADLEKAAATRAVRASSTTPARTAARARRILVERSVLRRVPRAARAGRAGRAGRSTRRDDDSRDGPADLSAGQRDARRGVRRRRVDVAFRGAAPGRRRASGTRRPSCSPTSTERPGLARGGLRPGRRGDAVRRRGRRGRGWPTTPSTACPARSGPATSAGRCGSRAASRPATSSSTRTPRCATGRRSAASSSPASAASSARTRRRVHRGEERLHQHGRLTGDDETARHGRTPRRTRSPSSPAAARRHRAGDRARGSPRRAPRSSSATSTTTRGRGARRRARRRCTSHVDVTEQGPGRRAVRDAPRTTYGSVDIAFNNAGISPPEDDSILDTDLDAWRRVQEVNLTRSTCAARRRCPTCSSRAAARSSTPRRSSR